MPLESGSGPESANLGVARHQIDEVQHYYFPWELEAAIRDFAAYCNNE